MFYTHSALPQPPQRVWVSSDRAVLPPSVLSPPKYQLTKYHTNFSALLSIILTSLQPGNLGRLKSTSYKQLMSYQRIRESFPSILRLTEHRVLCITLWLQDHLGGLW